MQMLYSKIFFSFIVQPDFFLGYASHLSQKVFRLGKKYEHCCWLDFLEEAECGPLCVL